MERRWRARVAVGKRGLVGLVLLAAGCGGAGSDDAPDGREGVLAGADVELHYRVVGEGRDTVVVVHGGPGAGIGSVFPDFRRLADDGRLTLVFFDQRGGGRSTLPDTSRLAPADFVADLDSVRSHFGLDRMRLLAHSFGAILVAAYAERHPDRVGRIVLHGATGPARAEAGRAARAAAARAAASPDTALSGRSSLLLRSLLDGTADDPVAACRFWESAGRRLAEFGGDTTRWQGTTCDAPAEAVRYYYRYTAQLAPAGFGDWDFTDRLGAVLAPVLVVADARDSLDAAMQAAWVRAYPNGRLFAVAAPGKTAIADAPDFVADTIAAFLATDPD